MNPVERVGLLQRRMAGEGLDAFLVSDANNRRYLSGFTGSAGSLLVLPERTFLLTDFRYAEQASQEASGVTVVSYVEVLDSLARVLQDAGVRRVGFEADYVSYRAYTKLRDRTPDVEWIASDGWVESLRAVKDSFEIKCIRKAVELADEAVASVLPGLGPGMTEMEVSLELEQLMRRNGAEKVAFETIVASGPRGALPHAKASERRLELGDCVVIDTGAVFGGYHSDITRTVFIGTPDAELSKVYRIVLEAQHTGLRAVRPGRSGAEVDTLARKVIEDQGYGEFFGHSLGHGIGLSVHEERPRLARTSDILLEPGMVVSVEPGIYLPGLGGVRIEDLVLVTSDGAKVLTNTPKDLVSYPTAKAGGLR